MGKKTAIAWTDHTFNPWIGCTEVGPGCDNCYARELDKRYKWGGRKHWGIHVPRHLTSPKSWDDVQKWNRAREVAMGLAALGRGPMPRPDRVFCASLADVFDNEVDQRWRDRLWGLINATPYLEWLLLTKRIGNARAMLPANWLAAREGMPVGKRNVRLMASVVNQEEADRDIPKLLALPFKNGISYEPALGPVDWAPWLLPAIPFPRSHPFVQWIIVGGESTQGAGKARPFDLAWARSTIAQCRAAGVPVFVKQLGSAPYFSTPDPDLRFERIVKARAGEDPLEWPEDLRVQEFPT